MYGGGHPDHGLGGVAGQHSAGTGMESAYGGAASLAAGQNTMGAFLDVMQKKYGLQSVTNFVNNYLNKQHNQLDYDSQTFGYNPVAPVTAEHDLSQYGHELSGAFANALDAQNLEMSGRMTPDQLAALDAAQQNTQNFTAFDQGFIDQMMEASPQQNYGPEYGGGGDYYLDQGR